VLEIGTFLGAPSPHAFSLAGTDLLAVPPPLVRVDEAREVVVVTSRSRDPGREIFLESCRRDGVPVVVRPTGGGAVVLAPGVVAASVVRRTAPLGLFPEPYFHVYCGLVAGVLSACSVPGVEMRGTSDLCLDDRKIAGSSLRLWQDLALFQVSLLVDVDVRLFDRYLRVPSREPSYRQGRTHREFVVTLREAGFAVTCGEVIGALWAALAGA
jgi:lipoate-protein ligase A